MKQSQFLWSVCQVQLLIQGEKKQLVQGRKSKVCLLRHGKSKSLSSGREKQLFMELGLMQKREKKAYSISGKSAKQSWRAKRFSTCLREKQSVQRERRKLSHLLSGPPPIPIRWRKCYPAHRLLLTGPPRILEGITYIYLKLYILSEHFPPLLFVHVHVVCCVESWVCFVLILNRVCMWW